MQACSSNTTVLVFGGAGFETLDMLSRDSELAAQLRTHHPNSEFVYLNSPFPSLVPPYMVRESLGELGAAARFFKLWATKAGFNEGALRDAAANRTSRHRVIIFRHYGFCIRTIATYGCADPAMLDAIRTVHDCAVSTLLPRWGLPIPHYVIMDEHQGAEALVPHLRKPWNPLADGDELLKYAEHYTASAGAYFVEPQHQPIRLRPDIGHDQLIAHAVAGIGELLRRH
jgi:hypothetical protein